jgi:hypothetical protein
MDNFTTAELMPSMAPASSLRALNRWKAFAIHLAISVLMAALVVTLVMVLWYPGPYFAAMGGATLLRLLIGVDVVLGPLITLIIFDTRKPNLKYDLAAIAVLQLAALAYGSYVMFEARPVYTVYIGGYFTTVSADSVNAASRDHAVPAFKSLPLDGPRVVGARKPTDPDEAFRIASGALSGGPDIVNLPHLFVPYAELAAEAANAAKPLSTLSKQGKEFADKVSDFAKADATGRSLGYVPIKARNEDFAAILDRKTGEIVGYLAVKPW